MGGEVPYIKKWLYENAAFATQVVAPAVHSYSIANFVEEPMYRRQFLQSLHVMGANIILPASEPSGEDGSVITPKNTPVLVAPGKVVEVAASVWGVPKVGIVAIGGLGSAVLNDIEGRLPYVGRSIAIDTDVRSLRRVKADCKIRVGDDSDLPRDHQGARLLAQSSVPEIADAVAGLDMVFLVAGMGGAAGSGIARIVAKILREQNILTLAFASFPTSFENQQRWQIAQTGIQELRSHVDALLPFYNGNTAHEAVENASFTSVSTQAALVFNQLWQGILKRPGSQVVVLGPTNPRATALASSGLRSLRRCAFPRRELFQTAVLLCTT